MVEEHEASIGGMKLDKKHLLYIGGALASIVALIWIMKNRQASSTMPVTGVPSSGAGGGGSTDALAAAQIAAASNLAVEQGREAIQTAQIASAEKIALANQATQLSIAQGSQSVAKQGQVLGALTSPAGMAAAGQAGKTLAQTWQDLMKMLGLGGEDTAPTGGTTYPNPVGPLVPSGWTYNEATGAWQETSTLPPIGGTIYNEPIGPSGEWPFTSTAPGSYDAGIGGGSSTYYGESGGVTDTGENP